jgi:hypothetical protein
MGSRRTRFRILRPRVLWLLLGGTVAAGMLLAAVFWIKRPRGHDTDLETYKLVMQFALVTLVGGAVFLVFAILRHREERRLARYAALQTLDREVDGAYRALKKAKRMLRAACGGAIAPPYSISKKKFESLMEEFLDAELEVELLLQHIAARDDLLSESEIDTVTENLDRAKIYYHDIYEDYEYGKVPLRGGNYVVGESAARLAAFLKPTTPTPSVEPKAGPDAFDAVSETLRNAIHRTRGLGDL